MIPDLPVLIIDDERDICFMLSTILKQKAIATKVVHSISEAGQWLSKQIPSLVFLDNNLPDGKGVDFLADVKRIAPSAKVVLITAYDTPNDRRQAMDNGADGFIGKPFDRQMVYSALDKLLN